MSIAVVTYPRSGSTYLAWLLSLSLNQGIDKFHLDQPGELEKLNSYTHSVATVREPVSSITSIVTMESFYFRRGQDFNFYVSSMIDKRIKEYITFYNTAKDRIDFLFDYNDINTKRDELVSYIAEQTGNKIINKKYVDVITDKPENNFLKTSTKSGEYILVEDLVLNHDLSDCFAAYNSCIEQVVHL